MLSSERLIKCADINGVVTQRSTNEIALECSFTWQENVTGPFIPADSYKEYLPELEKNAEKLVLTKLSEEVGYGVLTDQRADPIQTNELVTIYAANKVYHPGDAYELRGLSAWKTGNMGRFFPHLFTRLELVQFDFHESVNMDEVAVANLRVVMLGNGKHIPAFAAIDKIPGGKILGISYGQNYWEALGITPRLFYKSGKIIDDKLYKRTPARRKYYDLLITTACLIKEDKDSKEEGKQLLLSKTPDELNEKTRQLIAAKCGTCSEEALAKWVALYVMHTIYVLEQMNLIRNNFIDREIPTHQFNRISDCMPQMEGEYNFQMLKEAVTKFAALLTDDTLTEFKPALEPANISLIRLLDICEERQQAVEAATSMHDEAIKSLKKTLDDSYPFFMDFPYIDDATEEEAFLVCTYVRLMACVHILDAMALRVNAVDAINQRCQQFSADDHLASKIAGKLMFAEGQHETASDVISDLNSINALNKSAFAKQRSTKQKPDLLGLFSFLPRKKEADMQSYVAKKFADLTRLVTAYDKCQDMDSAFQTEYKPFIMKAIEGCLELLGKASTRIAKKGLSGHFDESTLASLARCSAEKGSYDLAKAVTSRAKLDCSIFNQTCSAAFK